MTQFIDMSHNHVRFEEDPWINKQIMGRQDFTSICKCDLYNWPTDLLLFMTHPLEMSSNHVQFDEDHWNNKGIMAQTRFYFNTSLWPK